MKKIFFQEEQRFSQSWVWIPVFISFISVLAIIAGSFYLGKSTEESSNSSDLVYGLLTVTAAFSFIFWLIYKMKLFTSVTGEELVYSFPPLIRKEKKINKEEIVNYEIRKYKAIREYGGYGIRKRRWNHGKAYNVSGNIGMQLYLKDGKKILFGTQRPEAFKYAMDKMMGKA